MINVFIILRLREKIGLQIDSQHYEMIPIVKALDISNIFKKYMKEGVCPRNYSSVNEGDFNDEAPMGLSQETSQYNTQDDGNDEKLEENFRRNVESNVANEGDVNKTQLNAYAVLMPFPRNSWVYIKAIAKWGICLPSNVFSINKLV